MLNLRAPLSNVLRDLDLTIDTRPDAIIAESRNVVLRATRGTRQFIVKTNRVSGEGGVAHEIGLLPQLSSLALDDAQAPSISQVFAVRDDVLVLELLEGPTLFQIRKTLTVPTFKRLAESLAWVHALPVENLSVHYPATGDLLHHVVRTSPTFYASLAPASRALWHHVQANRRAVRQLEKIASFDRAWASSIVHGDFRLPNLLAVTNNVAVIDWESAGRGDPARDIGMFMGEFLARDDLFEADGQLRMNRPVVKRLISFARQYTKAMHRRRRPLGAHFSQRVRAWTSDALIRRAFTTTYYRNRFGPTESSLIDRAVRLIAEPSSTMPALFEGALE